MYVTSINQSHFFCIPVLLLFYKLLLLLICYDILAIENYLQCRTDDGGGGSRNHLQAWLFLPLNMLKRFLFFKGKGVSFSISKKGWTMYCNLCKLYTCKGHTWWDVWQDQFWQIKPLKFMWVAAMPQMKFVAILLTDLELFFDINWYWCTTLQRNYGGDCTFLKSTFGKTNRQGTIRK